MRVRQALCFTVAQFPEVKRKALAERLGQGKSLANTRRAVASYAVGDVEEHFLTLVARYYCQDRSRLREDLQFETQMLDIDPSKLLLALWMECPDEIQDLMDEWRESSSSVLQNSARRFSRLRDKSDRTD